MVAVDLEAGPAPDLDDAYRRCAEVVRGRYENFSVVSVFIPKSLRPHFCAIYAFCRGVDDLGDEYAGDRLAALDEWERQLRACYGGAPSHFVFQALQATIRHFQLPDEPFLQLIEANRLDQRKHQYATWDELLAYCHLSANPVGRLVLALFGFRDEERQRLSDQICTGLQVANHLQDLGRDVKRGRLYLPEADLVRFGASPSEVKAQRATDGVRACIRYEAERARRMFADGARLEDLVPYRLRLQLRLYRYGGEAILNALSAQDYDPFDRRPVVSTSAKLGIAVRALW
jgi:squalene synthase HpnC